MRYGGLRALASVLAIAALAAACEKPVASGPPGTQPGMRPGGGENSAAAWAKWGLKPLPAAPHTPDARPLKRRKGAPVPVFSNVPTRDKVVFVTLDDGAEKDPKFVEMLTELKVPVTMFLTDSIIRNDYGYFTRLQALGNHVQNHTMTHPVMRQLGPEGQRQQICGDQKVLTRQYGTAPKLFRPPYGMWNSLTQQAAAECGIEGIVLWTASMQIHDMQYDDPNKRLHPGDVLLAHFRGPAQLKGTTMTEMFANMLKRIQRQGFAVARLEDYLRVR
ncbi:polysaccharide deacetylase family protein [Actinomadura macrotermitis]|uniref:NodB homology domain-containing protein n=1 Tax=Actinomadura macrotermitis TaxID=2585200 RepID=A0A7K0BX16_9ACTN|nr:hypothetical protein [Actinomadura macrotermitis]